ncbi:MAG: ion transporter [candidate division KSB1 bacterium]
MRFDRIFFMRAWDVILALSVSGAALITPLRLVMHFEPRGVLLYWDELLTLLFGVDVVLRMLAARKPPLGNAAGYPTAWRALDVLAALPMSLLFGNVWWEVLRLLKLARIGRLMRHARKRATKNSNFLRLAFFIYWLLLAIHGIACGWLALRGATPGEEASNYLRALYWTVQTFATVGYGDLPPENDAQTAYAIVVMLIGAGVYSYVIGNVASLLANINPARVRHLDKLE